MDRTKFLMEHFGLTKRPNPTYKQYFTFGELQKLLINYEKAINYSRCCKSDSEQLKDRKIKDLLNWVKSDLKLETNNKIGKTATPYRTEKIKFLNKLLEIESL